MKFFMIGARHYFPKGLKSLWLRLYGNDQLFSCIVRANNEEEAREFMASQPEAKSGKPREEFWLDRNLVTCYELPQGTIPAYIGGVGTPPKGRLELLEKRHPHVGCEHLTGRYA